MNTQQINNRYTVVKELGSGMMGQVFLVIDTLKNNQQVALKTIKQSHINQKHLESFKVEFEIMSRLTHPNLLHVYDFGKTDDNYYITMEYVADNTLEKIVVTPDLSDSINKPDIMIDLLRAVEFIHSRNILHRDIKPGNIIIGESGVKLMDFGLADLGFTNEVRSKGTISYMAPEVLQNKKIRGQVDIFSLGVTFYEIITNQKFFQNKANWEIISLLANKTMYQEFQDSLNLDDLILPGIGQIIKKMTAFSAKDRYENCITIIDDFNNSLNSSYPPETTSTKESYVLGAGFIGREHELSILKSHIYEKSSCAILVYGEAGIGKSRLIFELKKHCLLHDMKFLEGNCYENLLSLYAPFITILKECFLTSSEKLIQEHGNILKKIIPDHPALKDCKKQDFENPKKEKEAIIKAITGYLATYGELNEQKTILYINDIQWADAATISILEELVKNVVMEKLKIIISSREEGIRILSGIHEHPNLQSLRLKPFNRSNVANYINGVFGQHRAGHTIIHAIDYINKKVGGNPFFLQELLKSMIENNHITRNLFMWSLEKSIENVHIPGTLNELIISRLNFLELNQTEIILLETFALLNRRIAIDELRKITKTNNEAILKLERIELIKKELYEGRFFYTISHDLIRENVIKKIKDPEVRHEKLGFELEQLNQTKYIDELAYHFSHSNNKEKALYYLEKAADNANSKYYQTKAVELYDDLLQYIDHNNNKKRCEILLKQTAIYRELSNWEKLEQTIKTTIKNATIINDTKILAESYYYYASLSHYVNNHNDAITYSKKAIGYYEEIHDLDSATRSYGQLAFYYYYHLYDFSKAVEAINKALLLAGQTDNISVRYATMNSSGLIYYFKGDAQNAIKYLTKAVEYATELNQKFSIAVNSGYLGASYNILKQRTEALYHLNYSINTARQIDSPNAYYYFIAEKVKVLFEMSRFEEARPLAEEVLKYAIEHKEPVTLYYSHLYLNKLKFVDGKKTKAINGLLEMIKHIDRYQTKDKFTADLYYELWKMTSDQEYKKKALSIYTVLYEKSQNDIDKAKIDELKSDNLKMKKNIPKNFRRFYG